MIKSLEQRKSILTARETEYLVLSAAGCTNIEIAEVLTVSLSTVKKTFECIFFKLKAKNKTHAVTIAFTHEILSVSIITEVLTRYATKLNECDINNVLSIR